MKTNNAALQKYLHLKTIFVYTNIKDINITSKVCHDLITRDLSNILKAYNTQSTEFQYSLRAVVVGEHQNSLHYLYGDKL